MCWRGVQNWRRVRHRGWGRRGRVRVRQRVGLVRVRPVVGSWVGHRVWGYHGKDWVRPAVRWWVRPVINVGHVVGQEGRRVRPIVGRASRNGVEALGQNLLGNIEGAGVRPRPPPGQMQAGVLPRPPLGQRQAGMCSVPPPGQEHSTDLERANCFSPVKNHDLRLSGAYPPPSYFPLCFFVNLSNTQLFFLPHVFSVQLLVLPWGRLTEA